MELAPAQCSPKGTRTIAGEISVVIATLGASKLLERCVRAIGSGALRPRELILVDQGPPGLDAALRSWLRGSGVQARHLALESVGVSRARNAGAAVACGEWLAFTDDDCVPQEHWLAALAAAIEVTRASGATGRVLPLASSEGGLVAVSSRTETTPRWFEGSRTLPWEAGTGGNLLLSRAAFDAVAGFDERFGPGACFQAAEDIELIDRLLSAGASLKYEPAAIVHHEMKTVRERLARRYPYGFGMGALAATRTDSRFRQLAAAYLAMQVRALVGAAACAAPRGVVEPVLSVAGFAVGAWTAGVRRPRGER